MPQIRTEQYLWTITDGKTEVHALGTLAPVRLLHLDGASLYAVTADSQEGKSGLYLWNGTAFVKDLNGNSDELLKLHIETTEKERTMGTRTRISDMGWDDTIGRGRSLSIPVGTRTFDLMMTRTKETDGRGWSPESNPESWFTTFDLDGKWAGQATMTRLYTTLYGMHQVDRQTYDRYLGLGSR